MKLEDLNVCLADIQSMLFRSQLREALNRYRKAECQRGRKTSFLRLGDAIDTFVSMASKLDRLSIDILTVFKLDILKSNEYWQEVLASGSEPIVKGSLSHKRIVQLQSRLMFVEGNVPLLLNLISENNLQSLPKNDSKLALCKGLEKNVVVVVFENKTTSGKKHRRLGEAMGCLESLYLTISQLTRQQNCELTIELVDKHYDELRLIGKYEIINIVNGMLAALAGIRLLENLSSIPVKSQFDSLPVFDLLKRTREFGSFPLKYLDNIEDELKSALHHALVLGIQPHSEFDLCTADEERRLHGSYEGKFTAPLGGMELTANDDGSTLPNIEFSENVNIIPHLMLEQLRDVSGQTVDRH